MFLLWIDLINILLDVINMNIQLPEWISLAVNFCSSWWINSSFNSCYSAHPAKKVILLQFNICFPWVNTPNICGP